MKHTNQNSDVNGKAVNPRTTKLNIHLLNPISKKSTLVLFGRKLVSTRGIQDGHEFGTWFNNDDKDVTEVKFMYLTSDRPFEQNDLVMHKNKDIRNYDELDVRLGWIDKSDLVKVEGVMHIADAISYHKSTAETGLIQTKLAHVIPLKFIDFYVEQFNNENYLTTVEAKLDEDDNLMINPWDELVLVF